MKTGLPIVVSAPSGGGKSTIVEEALKKIPNAVRSVSCTTRPSRRGEKNGRDYYFISESEFKSKIKSKAFLEWARVHGHYYGTPLRNFKNQLQKGTDVFLTIDPQGARSIRKFFPYGVFIFVTPPTWSILLKRLKKRGTDNKNDLKIRLKNAKKELKTVQHYDYLVLNTDLAKAVDEVRSIVRSEHQCLSRISVAQIPIFK